MGLHSGQTNNPNGRPKGSINKMSQELRESITDFLKKHFDDVITEWQKLEGKEKLTFYRDLLKYAVPTLSTMQLETEFERLPDDQLDKIINELKNGTYDKERED